MQYGYFKYQVISFNYFNVLPKFRAFINKIIVEKLDIFVILYFNNVLIYIKNAGYSYVKTVRYVFKELQKYDLFANLKKCRFY